MLDAQAQGVRQHLLNFVLEIVCGPQWQEQPIPGIDGACRNHRAKHIPHILSPLVEDNLCQARIACHDRWQRRVDGELEHATLPIVVAAAAAVAVIVLLQQQ